MDIYSHALLFRMEIESVVKLLVQYRHLIPAPVDLSVCQCLVEQTYMDNISKNKASTLMFTILHHFVSILLLLDGVRGGGMKCYWKKT